MDDKGEIISSCDVDENLALQIWTKGSAPRIVVFNKTKNSRKLIRLNWLEKLDRKLSVQGQKRGSSVEYSLTELLPVSQKVIAEYAVYTHFKPRLWKFTALLEKILHTPAIISDKGELSLLPEEKRASLWIADMTAKTKGEGLFRPFFPLSEKEKGALNEEGIPFTENRRTVEDLIKTGNIRKLAVANPQRWHRSIRIMACAMLLAFSFCEEDGSEFSDELWKEDPEKPLNFKISDPRLRGLGRKFVGYVRHYSLLDFIETRVSLDSDKELQEKGFSRKRRLAFPEGHLGDVAYSVTFFENEDGTTALGCKPKAATLRHKGELIYTFPTERYEEALVADTLGGASDDYFTVGQLAAAKSFQVWSENVVPYISSFAGLG